MASVEWVDAGPTVSFSDHDRGVQKTETLTIIMNVENYTPFPAVAWESVDAEKQWHITSLVRVRYVFHATGTVGKWELRLTPDQHELFGGDIYFDNDINRPVRYESDFIPYKPRADIVINARTHAPGEKPLKHWQCGVTVVDRRDVILNQVTLNVVGEHEWHYEAPFGWLKTGIRSVKTVPVRYDRAYGGQIPDSDAEEGASVWLIEDEKNPSGTGIKHRKMDRSPFPAHQISWSDELMKTRPYPAGLGFISRTWKHRLSFAGTYDPTWLDEQHPYPPHDFDYFHNQAANPELILEGYVKAGTGLIFANLMPNPGLQRFHIPELYCFAEYISSTGDIQRNMMNIDTVLVDIDHEDPKQWSVYLSYRYFAPKGTAPEVLRMSYLPKEQLERQHGR